MVTPPTVTPETRQLDRLNKQIDNLYYPLARACGLSECAYWLLYGVQTGGGSKTQSLLADEFSYSRKTVNSALKGLVERGLVSLEFREGSRRDKLVSLTEAGSAFSERYIVPAVRAEARAMASLPAPDRAELLRLLFAYTSAIEAELTQLYPGEARGEARP